MPWPWGLCTTTFPINSKRRRQKKDEILASLKVRGRRAASAEKGVELCSKEEEVSNFIQFSDR